MRKRFNAGELRTAIVIEARAAGLDADGYPADDWTALYSGASVYCKWVNVHGREVYEAERLNLREAATLTLRYSPQINPRCRILRRDELDALPAGASADGIAYEIVSLDDVQDRHELLEIKVKRAVVA